MKSEDENSFKEDYSKLIDFLSNYNSEEKIKSLEFRSQEAKDFSFSIYLIHNKTSLLSNKEVLSLIKSLFNFLKIIKKISLEDEKFINLFKEKSKLVILLYSSLLKDICDKKTFYKNKESSSVSNYKKEKENLKKFEDELFGLMVDYLKKSNDNQFNDIEESFYLSLVNRIFVEDKNNFSFLYKKWLSLLNKESLFDLSNKTLSVENFKDDKRIKTISNILLLKRKKFILDKDNKEEGQEDFFTLGVKLQDLSLNEEEKKSIFIKIDEKSTKSFEFFVEIYYAMFDGKPNIQEKIASYAIFKNILSNLSNNSLSDIVNHTLLYNSIHNKNSEGKKIVVSSSTKLEVVQIFSIALISLFLEKIKEAEKNSQRKFFINLIFKLCSDVDVLRLLKKDDMLYNRIIIETRKDLCLNVSEISKYPEIVVGFFEFLRKKINKKENKKLAPTDYGKAMRSSDEIDKKRGELINCLEFSRWCSTVMISVDELNLNKGKDFFKNVLKCHTSYEEILSKITFQNKEWLWNTSYNSLDLTPEKNYKKTFGIEWKDFFENLKIKNEILKEEVNGINENKNKPVLRF